MQPLARASDRRGRRNGSAWDAGLDDQALRSLRTQPRARGPPGLMGLEPEVLNELSRAVGGEHVITSSNDLRIFERDASIEGATPDAVVLPANTAEVSAVIKIAAKHRIPVVPRGAGTGLSGGAVTNHGVGMEVVLADGNVHWVSGDAPDRVGLDLCGVLVGSEGTLCAITKIKVRLLRLPPSVATLLAAFPTIETASQAVSAVIGRGIVPAALEMMDQVTVGAVEAHYHAGYPTDAGAVLLVEVDGIAESTSELMAAIRTVLGENQGYAMREAQTPSERDLLWAGRKGAIGALGRIKPNYYLHDGVVPRSRLPQILSAVGEIGVHYKLPVANVFHAGDGNLHPNILFDLRDSDVLPQVENAGEEMLRAVVELGGALSGEHGIGLEKSAFMPWVYSPDDLDAMWRVKGALDGAGIMNPGKIFPDPDHKRPHLAGRTGLAVEAKWW